jgi:xanthine dehydrogenase accessory factor
MKPGARLLVRGSGDIGSAVAHRLFQAGYAVVLHETPQPTAARRQMAFTDALFDGSAWLEGVEARRLDDLTRLETWLAAREVLPVTALDFAALLQVLRPQALVDARMRKHLQPENQLSLAPLTIGLGPNFVAGETVRLAVETGWGEHLGKVLAHGAPQPLEGEPKAIAGHARDRYVYAPQAGIFETTRQIGERVTEGEELARIGETRLFAPISGVLRGLTHDNVPVQVKTKVIEVDPRADAPQVAGIGERPARIAAGVLAAIQAWEF